MRNNDPPETTLTFARLKKEGFNDFEVKQLIGQCIACELSAIFKTRQPFNEKRYVKNLNRLPNKPNE